MESVRDHDAGTQDDFLFSMVRKSFIKELTQYITRDARSFFNINARMNAIVSFLSFFFFLMFIIVSFGGFEDEDEVSPHDGGPLMFHSVADRLDTLMLVLLTFIRDMSHVNSESLARTNKYADYSCVMIHLNLRRHCCVHRFSRRPFFLSRCVGRGESQNSVPRPGVRVR